MERDQGLKVKVTLSVNHNTAFKQKRKGKMKWIEVN